MRGELERQLVGFEDAVRGEVGEWHLGGRDQIETVLRDVEQIVCELRQLSRAHERVGVHEIRHVDLAVAVLAGMHVQHELHQRAMQTRNGPVQRHEAAAGQPARELEVDAAEHRAEIDVILRLEIERRRLAPAALLAIVLLALADRHALVNEIWDAERDVVDPRLDRVEPRLGGLELLAELAHLGDQRRDVLARRLGLADRLGARVALVLQRLGAYLHFLALALERLDARHVERVAARGETLGGLAQLTAK